MSKKEKINNLLQKEIANIVSKEIDLENYLITIVGVDSSPELTNAKIRISVIPENMSGTALRKLRKNTSLIAKELSQKTNLRKIPKLNWQIDSTERKFAELDKII